MQNFKENFKLYVLSVLLILNLFIWSAVFDEQDNTLKVAFFDVGQGDAIFIKSPNGKQVLIDGGSNRAVMRNLGRVMPFYDRSIDIVIMTHPDADHLGGLLPVLKDYDVDLVMESGVETDSEIYLEYKRIVEEKGIKSILARQGQTINLGNDAYLSVLFPVSDTSDFETNTASVILKLVYGESSFLFTGDSPQVIEKYLAGFFGNELDIDVLKLGHHGSKTSNSELFLGITSPEYVVASVEKDNRYGHPHKEVLDLLEKLNLDLLRTDESGMIVFESDGGTEYQVSSSK
ncbi:MAG: Metallo-beta-lactamase domain protein [Candidatus Campbellbacteria bacterium GW2011_GWD1_35_49]|nr:MAG: internalization-like protein competence protein ComEC/Rec2, competence protein ComEC protein [Candidatus Campbellbacteria bacterium GW2011_OD1_34_28]KKP74527.1 MAG: Metallo-beta-lactamase domain protein [Candidatus Campbellbacteria bacterium GW2011_GWD2_35_24]KKP76526.1 MAG: Metallo-beta-lactamase domain protein [Candidatus Campbellbacteria bacterium GW2011_GWC1_35_31]KKP78565.1 MAG: Metallo-beta-lactamase domain protein [Candidatus Campbellbacteria bacterium GW2011_GWD1_35_49]HAP74423.